MLGPNLATAIFVLFGISTSGCQNTSNHALSEVAMGTNVSASIELIIKPSFQTRTEGF